MLGDCGGPQDVDVTIVNRLGDDPILWCVCRRHGRLLVDLVGDSVRWLGVENHGWKQGDLFA